MGTEPEAARPVRLKGDTPLRLLPDESLNELSHERRIEAHSPSGKAADEFLDGDIEGLKASSLQPEERRLRDASNARFGTSRWTTRSCHDGPKGAGDSAQKAAERGLDTKLSTNRDLFTPDGNHCSDVGPTQLLFRGRGECRRAPNRRVRRRFGRWKT